MTIRKAVIPVAGFGTRVLPASKAIPKELLPVFDRPAIDWVVEEARAAGIEQFVFVTARGKGAIEDYFDKAYELEATLEGLHGRLELLLGEFGLGCFVGRLLRFVGHADHLREKGLAFCSKGGPATKS